MKILLGLCSALLLLGLFNFPNGYYTFLRIIITIGAIVVVIVELENGINLWVISIGLIAILFNPIIPVYFNDKSIWLPIDIVAALVFAIKAFTLKRLK